MRSRWPRVRMEKGLTKTDIVLVATRCEVQLRNDGREVRPTAIGNLRRRMRLEYCDQPRGLGPTPRLKAKLILAQTAAQLGYPVRIIVDLWCEAEDYWCNRPLDRRYQQRYEKRYGSWLKTFRLNVRCSIAHGPRQKLFTMRTTIGLGKEYPRLVSKADN